MALSFGPMRLQPLRSCEPTPVQPCQEGGVVDNLQQAQINIVSNCVELVVCLRQKNYNLSESILKQ